jgi:hypothetical protein
MVARRPNRSTRLRAGPRSVSVSSLCRSCFHYPLRNQHLSPLFPCLHIRQLMRSHTSLLSSSLSVDTCASASTEWLNEMSNGMGGYTRTFEVQATSPVFYGYMLHSKARFALYESKPARLPVSLSTLCHVYVRVRRRLWETVDEPTSRQRLQKASGRWSHELYCRWCLIIQ